MIPIVLSISRVLAAIATNLDRNPHLVRSTTQTTNTSTNKTTEGATGRVSFVEDAANVVREAFIKCLAGSPGVPRSSRPTPSDKRIGIYATANSALKLLLRCHRLRNAQQIFRSIDQQSPPLSYYPVAQRVTYLYYLGRYHFANNHFFRAQRVLQMAYDQCHRDAVKQRRVILIYLIAANITMGRFPSAALLARPETQALAQHFLPLCKIIQTGDLGSFESFFDLASPSAEWFLKRKILFQLQNRCEILVWRSLIRRTYIHIGKKLEENSKAMPQLDLKYVQAAARWALNRRESGSSNGFGANESNGEYVDAEFRNIDAAIRSTGFDPSSGLYLDENIGKEPPPDHDYTSTSDRPSMREVESVIMSLLQQGFLKGFALHTNPRFAIPGSSGKGGPTVVGFPPVCGIIAQGDESGQQGPVPGWVEEMYV
jgi:nuclear mRNA export protein PCID2/THP1